MTTKSDDVVVIDTVRTAFGRAGEKGLFWKTRAEDLVVPLLKALIERNPGVEPGMIEDSIWGVTNQMKEQGGTLGRMVTMLADWGWDIPGCSVDRMCASGLTAVGFGVGYIKSGMADTYAFECQQKAHRAIEAGKMADMIIPLEVELNEAFAVQALYCLDRLGLKGDDPRVNVWGGALAYGHPLASSGPRLIAYLNGIFRENPQARYGLTTMCVGRGQGYSMIWENLQ